jgi:hypothetical protein
LASQLYSNAIRKQPLMRRKLPSSLHLVSFPNLCAVLGFRNSFFPGLC